MMCKEKAIIYLQNGRCDMFPLWWRAYYGWTWGTWGQWGTGSNFLFKRWLPCFQLILVPMFSNWLLTVVSCLSKNAWKDYKTSITVALLWTPELTGDSGTNRSGELPLIDTHGEAPLRIGIVTCFIRHEISCIWDPLKPQSSSTLSHILAHIKWYMDHPRRDCFHPSIVVCATVFDVESPACYMPVSRIAGRCAIAPATIGFDYGENNVIFAVPLLKGIWFQL